MTLSLPQKTVTTKLMRNTMYIPRHWNFFCFSNWPSFDLDKLFDLDTGEYDDDGLDKGDSITLVSSILVLKDDELLVCKE